MESFQLSLNQVNFESYDIGDEPLHSFSNLVSFDSDFKTSEGDGIPVASKKLNLSEVSSNSNSCNWLEQYQADSGVHLYGHSFEPEEIVDTSNRNMEIELSTSSSQVLPVSDVYQTESMTLEQMNLDTSETFRAFTETVEALALQKSVIGSSTISPASSEEIAKAIAEAQLKLKQSSMSPERSRHVMASLVTNGCQSADIASDSHQMLTKLDLDPELESLDQSVKQEAIALQQDNTSLELSRPVTDLPTPITDSSTPTRIEHRVQSGGEGRQLIRITAKQIVTESTPKSSWLWSKKSVRSTTKEKSSLKRSTAITDRCGVAVLTRELQQTDEHAVNGEPVLRTSSSDANSTEIGNFNMSNSVLYNSCDGVYHAPPHDSFIQHGQHASSFDSHTSLPSSLLSYAFVLPESTIPAQPIKDFSTCSSSSLSSSANMSRQSSTVQCSNEDGGMFEKLLRDKAGLEGRLEVLERENRELLHEQADLKLKVAAAEQQMKTTSVVPQERNAIQNDLETLRQNRARLEAVIVDAHKLIAEKDQEVRTLERDLELARLAGEKHLERVADCRREITVRDVTIRDLKTKITELYVQGQTYDQSRKLTEGELGAIRADVAALIEAKDWYANQLRATQKDRSRLQAETASARAETIAAGVAAERLRAENARMKRNLTEMEHRVLVEKQTLARHLEEIEADMLEREASYMAQIRQATEAKTEITPTFSNDVEELETLKKQLKCLNENIDSLRHESVDLSRRLALSQQCIIDRDNIIKSLEHDREAAEMRAETAEQNNALLSADVRQMKLERCELEIQLETTHKEKEAFDQSLQSLKHDMAVLEANFRRMQNELAMKTCEIEKLTVLRIDKDSDELRELNTDPEMAAGLSSVTRDELQTKDHEKISSDIRSVNILDAEKVSVEVQTDSVDVSAILVSQPTEMSDQLLMGDNRLIAVSGELTHLSADDTVDSIALSSAATDAEKQLELQLTEKTQLTHQLQHQLVESKETVTNLQFEIKNLHEQFKLLEEEKLLTDSDRVSSVERSLQLECQVQKLQEERAELQQQIAEKDRQSLAVHSNTAATLQAENSSLQAKLAELEYCSSKEISKLKAKVLKLTKQLGVSSDAHELEKQEQEQKIDELMCQLSILTETNSRLHVEIDNVEKQTSLDADERTENLHKDLQAVRNELELSNAARVSLELELNSANSKHELAVTEYCQCIDNLKQELHTLEVFIDERRLADEQAAQLSLELEKEKGRHAGLLQSYNSLKDHTQALEAKLAEYSTSHAIQDSEIRDGIECRDHRLAELNSQLEVLQSTLGKEQQTLKDLRAQLMTEKGNHIKVRRQLEQLTNDHNQLIDEHRQLRENFAKMAADGESFSAREIELQMTVERLNAELRVAMLDRQRLMREFEDQKVRDVALQDNIQGLEWRLSEKDAEIAAANERLQLVEERTAAEMTSVTKTLQSTTAELQGVRDELTSCKKERSTLQVKLIQLRTALKSALSTKIDPTVSGQIAPEVEQLLHDAAPLSVSSKPLSFLQATLSGLRGEISSLQTQINEHTTAVQTSSLAWRELEAQVQDLREVCKTSAADRAAASSHQSSVRCSASDVGPSPRSVIVLPSAGPVIIPGKLVTVATSDPASETVSEMAETAVSSQTPTSSAQQSVHNL